MLIAQFTWFISLSKSFSFGTRDSSFLAISRTLTRCFSLSAVLILKSGECITLFRTFMTLFVGEKIRGQLCYPATVWQEFQNWWQMNDTNQRKVHFTRLTSVTQCFGMSLKCLQEVIRLKIAEISNSANVQCSLCPRDIYACMWNMPHKYNACCM